MSVSKIIQRLLRRFKVGEGFKENEGPIIESWKKGDAYYTVVGMLAT